MSFKESQAFPQINEVILYGSRAKGKFKPGSDIDLTIRKSTIDLKTLNEINSALEVLHLPYTFDLSIFENIQLPAMIEHITDITQPSRGASNKHLRYPPPRKWLSS